MRIAAAPQLRVNSGYQFERQGDSVVLNLSKGQTCPDLEKLLKSGELLGYQSDGSKITLHPRNCDSFEPQKLTSNENPVPQATGLWQKAKEFVVPNDVRHNCAAEYTKFRAWSLASSFLSCGMGYLMTAVYFDSLGAAFGGDGQKAAFAGVVTGTIQKAAQMGSYKLAKFGDADPKKAYLASSMISHLNSTVGLGLLAAAPGAHMPFYCANAVTSTVSSMLGSASSINVTNHLVPGAHKGEVGAKNANQDMIVSCFGMPIGLTLNYLCKSAGLNPAIVAACTLGPVAAFCSLQAVRALRMQPVDAKELPKLVSALCQNSKLPESTGGGISDTLLSLVRSKPKLEVVNGNQIAVPFQESSQPGQLLVGDSLQQLLKNEEQPQELFKLYQGKKYMLDLDLSDPQQPQFRAIFQKGCGLNDILTALCQANFAQQLKTQGWNRLEILKQSLSQATQACSKLTQQDWAQAGWHDSADNLKIPKSDAHWS